MSEPKKRGRPAGSIAKGRKIQFFAPAPLLRFLALQDSPSADIAAKTLLTRLVQNPTRAPIPQDARQAPIHTPPPKVRYVCKNGRCKRINMIACDECRKANGLA